MDGFFYLAAEENALRQSLFNRFDIFAREEEEYFCPKK